MELWCYIAIMLAMGVIAAVCAWMDDCFGYSAGPLMILGYLAGTVFAIMLIALIIGAIIFAFGVEVIA